MKPVMLLASLFIASQALAQPDPNLCVSRSLRLGPAERNAYMESCLAQVGSAANVQKAEQRHKMAQCEQNARNSGLRGGVRSNYIAKCITFNEAAVAANRVSVPAKPTPSPIVEKSISYVAKNPAAQRRKLASRQLEEPCVQ